MDAPTVTVVQGGHLSLKLTLKDAAEAPITSYTSAAVLSARVWPGDDQPAIATPAVSWIDATEGTIRLELSDAQTALIPPGSYPVELSITAGGVTARRRVAVLSVLTTAGTATALPSYCTLQDLTRRVRWIGDLLDSRQDQSGAAEQRYEAWRWINRQAMARYKRAALQEDRDWGSLREFQIGGGSALVARSSIEAELLELQGFLDDGRLDPDDPTIEAASRYALYLILDDQIGERDGKSYKELGNEQYTRAIWALAGCAFAIDTTNPADGIADLVLR